MENGWIDDFLFCFVDACGQAGRLGGFCSCRSGEGEDERMDGAHFAH